MDVFRVFDSLNYVDNLKLGIDAAGECLLQEEYNADPLLEGCKAREMKPTSSRKLTDPSPNSTSIT